MVLLACTAAVCIAACGGSSNTASTSKSTTSTTGKSPSFTALRSCLSKHGVTLPSRTAHGRAGGGSFFGGPRPGSAPGAAAGATGGTGTTPAGGPPTGTPGTGGGFARGGFAGGASSKFAQALKACGGRFRGFGAGRFRGGYGGGYSAGAAGGGRFRATFSKATLASFVSCVRKNGYPAMPEAKTNTTTGGFFPASVERNAKFQKASVKCVSILRKATAAANPGGLNQPATTITSSAT